MTQIAVQRRASGRGPTEDAASQGRARSRELASSAVTPLAGDLNSRSDVARHRTLGAVLNQTPQMAAQAKLADALSGRAAQRLAANSATAPVQRYFDAPHSNEIRSVEDYVAAIRPNLMDEFYEILNSEREVDLYDWLMQRMGVTMHGVYDWEDGIVRGQPLMMGNEAVRGTNDLPSDSDEELEEFRINLDEAGYSNTELKRLHHLLGARGAPHDAARRDMIKNEVYHRREINAYEDSDVERDDHLNAAIDEDDSNKIKIELKEQMADEYPDKNINAVKSNLFNQARANDDDFYGLQDQDKSKDIKTDFGRDMKEEYDDDVEDDIELDDGENDEDIDIENLYLTDSDVESSGTDTEGSDTDDDEMFRSSQSRKLATKARLKREKTLLKPDLFGQRLTDLGSSMLTKRSREEALGKALFKKGKRPKKSELYRKETKFKYPSVRVGDRAELPKKPTEQETNDLAQVNALLDLGVPIALAAQLIESKFVVAQYRGLFYSRNVFKKQTRARHRGLDETNRPVFASAALESGPLGTAGYYYLNAADDRQADQNSYQGLVAKEAERIREALLNLRKKAPREDTRLAVGRATDNFKPQSLNDISTSFYSQDYEGYHGALADSLKRKKEDKQSPLDPLFEGLTSAANPKVSTGDVPTHAARYAYGLKPYKGHESEVLEPEYDNLGKPKHPYSGRIYISIHPLTDYGSKGPEQLVELQRERRINIAQVILPEREAPFEGLVEPGRVKEQMAAKFPDFSKDYKRVYAEKYGLTPELFESFREALESTKPGSDEGVRRGVAVKLLGNAFRDQGDREGDTIGGGGGRQVVVPHRSERVRF